MTDTPKLTDYQRAIATAIDKIKRQHEQAVQELLDENQRLRLAASRYQGLRSELCSILSDDECQAKIVLTGYVEAEFGAKLVGDTQGNLFESTDLVVSPELAFDALADLCVERMKEQENQSQ